MKDYIYVKINTLPLEDDLQTDSEQFELFKRTYQDAREYMSDKDVIRSYKETAGRSPVFSKIQSISVAYVNSDEVRVNILEGEEKDIITELFNLLKNDFFKDNIMVSWNFEFLTGFLKLRPIAAGINVTNYPQQVNDSFNKSWSRKLSQDVFDLLNPGWNKISAINAFYALGLEWRDILSGEDLYTAYRAGEIEEIEKSNLQFIYNLVNLHRTLIGEEKVEKVVCVTKEVEDVQEERLPVLNRIYLNNEITAFDKKELKELLGSKRLTKKGKGILKDMLHSLSINSEMFVGDKPEVIEEKLKTVEELIDEL